MRICTKSPQGGKTLWVQLTSDGKEWLWVEDPLKSSKMQETFARGFLMCTAGMTDTNRRAVSEEEFFASVVSKKEAYIIREQGVSGVTCWENTSLVKGRIGQKIDGLQPETEITLTITRTAED